MPLEYIKLEVLVNETRSQSMFSTNYFYTLYFQFIHHFSNFLDFEEEWSRTAIMKRLLMFAQHQITVL